MVDFSLFFLNLSLPGGGLLVRVKDSVARGISKI